MNFVRLEQRLETVRNQLDELFAPAPNRKGSTVLMDLLLRSAESSQADGYPAGGGMSRQSEGSHSDPTMTAVELREADVCLRCEDGKAARADGTLRKCPTCNGTGRRWADPIADAISAMTTDLGVVCKAMKRVDAHRHKVLDASRAPKQSSLAGDCLACDRPVAGTPRDRMRRGMCGDCYKSWIMWKLRRETAGLQWDFVYFLPWRRQNLQKTTADEQVAQLQESKALPRPREANG
jgi:hypothetical protein